MKNSIYYHKQVGDLCRLCSLNSFYGFEKISKETFFKYCDDYDSLINGLKSRDMDGFAEGRSIISYILDIELKKFTFLIPLNSYTNARGHIINKNYYNKLIKYGITSYFEFNKNHIWINKKINNHWYKIDSITGITEIDPGLNNNGAILVIENRFLFIEIENYIIELKNIFRNTIIKTIEDIPEGLLFNLYFALKHIEFGNKGEFSKIAYLKEKLEIFIEFSRSDNKKNIELCSVLKNNVLDIEL